MKTTHLIPNSHFTEMETGAQSSRASAPAGPEEKLSHTSVQLIPIQTNKHLPHLPLLQSRPGPACGLEPLRPQLLRWLWLCRAPTVLSPTSGRRQLGWEWEAPTLELCGRSLEKEMGHTWRPGLRTVWLPRDSMGASWFPTSSPSSLCLALSPSGAAPLAPPPQHCLWQSLGLPPVGQGGEIRALEGMVVTQKTPSGVPWAPHLPD